MHTYEISELLVLRNIVKQLLIEKSKNFPSLEHLDQILLVLPILLHLRSLQDQSNNIPNLISEMSNIIALHILHNLVHGIQV